jgi:hypothetical protein
MLAWAVPQDVGEPGRKRRRLLVAPLQGLQRQAHLLGQLGMGPRAARGPALEGPALNEGEGQVPRPDGLGHALHRQATLFACPREADLQDINGSEGRHPPLTRDQDAVADQPLDLLLADARPGASSAPASSSDDGAIPFSSPLIPTTS